MAKPKGRSWREGEREGKKIKEKKKGGEERWMERRGVEPGVGRRRTLGGVGWRERVAKYRSSSLVRNKEQKIDRLLSFMFPGAGGEGGALALSLSLSPSSLWMRVCVHVRRILGKILRREGKEEEVQRT